MERSLSRRRSHIVWGPIWNRPAQPITVAPALILECARTSRKLSCISACLWHINWTPLHQDIDAISSRRANWSRECCRLDHIQEQKTPRQFWRTVGWRKKYICCSSPCWNSPNRFVGIYTRVSFGPWEMWSPWSSLKGCKLCYFNFCPPPSKVSKWRPVYSALHV